MEAPDRHDLLAAVEPVARKVAGLYSARSGVEFDDLYSDALLGVWRAVLTYDPERGVSLATYAGSLAYYAIVDGVRERNGRRQWDRGPLFHPLWDWESFASGEKPPDYSLECEEAFAVLLRKCPPGLMRESLRMVYGLGMTEAEVARALGYSPSRINVVVRDGLRWIADALGVPAPSSTAERPAHNGVVVGSTPTGPTVEEVPQHR